MHRLAVLADIHGNLPALQAVLADLQAESIDGYLVAGDLTGGPQPNETIRLLRQHNALLIRGNTDENILRYVGGEAPAAWRTSKQWAVMRWALDALEEENLWLLGSLPEQRVICLPEAAAIRMVHGSLRSSYEGLHPDRHPERLSAVLEELAEAVLVCGHIHIPWQLRRGEKLLLNPGSVAASLNGDPRAYYALLNWDGACWQAEQHAVGYDHALIRRAFVESGLLEQGGALARAFLRSIETGHDVSLHFFALTRRLLDEKNLSDLEVVPDEIWDQADRIFDWEKW